VDDDESVGTWTTGGVVFVGDDVGVPSGIDRIELGGGTGETGGASGRSWSGVSTPGGRAAGGCCGLSWAVIAVAVHEMTTAQKNRVVYFIT
jgi:hypothetical protein